MRKKQAVSGQNWDFDGKTITVHIPIAWKRRGGRKVITAPDGGDVWAPAKPRQDETLIRALARAHRWKWMLDEGKFRSAAEIAEAEKIARSFVNRLLRLALLAPDIVESILDGRQAKGLQLAVLTGKLPSAWEEQRQLLRTTFTRLDRVRRRHGGTALRTPKPSRCRAMKGKLLLSQEIASTASPAVVLTPERDQILSGRAGKPRTILPS